MIYKFFESINVSLCFSTCDSQPRIVFIVTSYLTGYAQRIMVIVLGNGTGDLNSSSGRGCLCFYFALMPLRKAWNQYILSPQLRVNSKTTNIEKRWLNSNQLYSTKKLTLWFILLVEKELGKLHTNYLSIHGSLRLKRWTAES